MMQVGRKVRAQIGGESAMILNVDEPVSREHAQAITRDRRHLSCRICKFDSQIIINCSQRIAS